MDTIIDVLDRVKHKTIYHADHIGTLMLILGFIVLEYGNLIGWTLSSRGLLGAVLIAGGCYFCTWVRKDDKPLLFFSGFFSTLLLILVVTKLKGIW